MLLTVLWLQFGAGLSRHEAGHEAMAILGTAGVSAGIRGADDGADGGAQHGTVDDGAGGGRRGL